MQRPSRRIDSAQLGPHAGLGTRVRRHLGSPWRRPIAAHTRAAFAAFLAWRDERPGPFDLDAGCGTGASTHYLAGLDESADVLGIDKSAHRLARTPADADADAVEAARVRLLRADLGDFWRLLRASDQRPRRQWLLYPNPWPKAAQVGRRWHAHPVFPDLVAVGGRLQLRSNWRVYVDEFAQALDLVGVEARVGEVDAAAPGGPVSPFERKYLASGQSCWRLDADLDSARLPGVDVDFHADAEAALERGRASALDPEGTS